MILAATSLDSFVQLITVLIIFVFVLILTYFTTRWMAGIQKGRSFNKNLRIIETISVGNNKMISIVEAGTKYIVVSIGKDDVNYLTELKEEELKSLLAIPWHFWITDTSLWPFLVTQRSHGTINLIFLLFY